MPGTKIRVDGLWRCLCPSVGASALRSSIEQPLVLRPRQQQLRCSAPTATTGQTQARRAYGTSPQRDTDKRPKPVAIRKHAVKPSDGSVSTKTRMSPWGLSAATPEALNEALRELRESDGNYKKIVAHVQQLLKCSGGEKTPFIYETLVKANCCTQGSADSVRELLKEMRNVNRGGLSSATYHAALRALSVHPDYLTRNSILKEMKERWLDLSHDGAQSVALGLLRDGQYEMALDRLDAMVSQGVETPPWFLDIFVYVLAQVGFHDEALKIVSHRVLKENDSISLNLWYFLLDSCSRSMHYPGVKYVWNRMVEPRILNPPDAMFLNILNTAARHGDSQLIANAIQLMSARGTKLGMHHFEALLDAYAGADEVANALQALCIMENAGVRPDRGSTRSLFQTLKRSPTLTEPAVSSLFSLRERFKIPLAAFNVVVEGLLEKDNADTALNLYRHVRQLCPEGPDATTFHLLTQKCSETKIADFLGRECASFKIRPTPETCSRVIYHSAKRGSLELALQYAFMLVNGGAQPTGDGVAPWMGDAAAEALVRRCFEDEDHRVWDVAQASKEGGRSMDHVVQYVLKDFPKERWQSPPEQAQPVVAEETAGASM